MAKKIVSIIVVNYKSKENLYKCINSINKKWNNEIFEIIVVDNDEVDNISKELKKKFSKIKYIKNVGNLGYGNGNNLGVDNANGEYVFILNPDTYILSGNLENLLNIFKKYKKVAAVSPTLYKENKKIYKLQGTRILTPLYAIFSLSFISSFLRKNKFLKKYYYLDNSSGKERSIEVLPGTAFLIKKKIFQKINGFDDNFFMYFEEFDLFKRIKELGYKNYISPTVRIVHFGGKSSTQNSEIKKIFMKSRYLYFKKNYGRLKAMVVELFLRFNKESFLVLCIFLLAFLLRINKISELLFFIPDVAWYYLSAKDMLLDHSIPLVGIASSHPWLHQGAYWTYILGFLLKVFDFNPVAPAYFTILLDSIVVILIYYVARFMFNTRVAFFSSLFYATSPFVIFSSQLPYHTSFVPLLTLALFFLTFKWVKGDRNKFPLIIFILGALYNFVLATFSLAFTVLVVLAIGYLKNKKWKLSFKNDLKIIVLSFIFLILTLLPMIIYDFSNGFPQTLKFFVWGVYRIAVLFGYPPINPSQTESWGSFLKFITDYIGKFYFVRNEYLALLIFIIPMIFLLISVMRSRFKNPNENTLFAFLIIPAIFYIFAKTNSASYLPMFFPQAAIGLGYFLGSFKKRLLFFPIILICIISFLNIYQFPDRKNQKITFTELVKSSREIVSKSNGEPFNIIEKNQASGFPNFIQNYEYLTWWLGNGPSNKNEKKKFYVSVENSNIIVEEVNNK